MSITDKERRKLKHSLKTEIDRSETWVLLALTGEVVEANNDPKTSQTREVIISHLKEMVSNGKNIAMRSYIPKEVFSSQEKVIIGNLQFSNNGDFSVLNSTDTSFVSYARCFVVL